MITEEYMRNVITGKAFCPKYSEIKMLPCPRPPNKDVLLKKFLEIGVTHNFQHTGSTTSTSLTSAGSWTS